MACRFKERFNGSRFRVQRFPSRTPSNVVPYDSRERPCARRQGRQRRSVEPAVFALVLLLAIGLAGCVSMQVQKARRGVDPVPLAAGLAPGASTLQDALARCGAPDEIVDMDPDFALHYRHLLQRGAKVSVGLPLKQAFMPNPSLETRGNLVRTDALVLVFTPAGILKDMRHEQATDRPLIEDYWQ